MDPLSTCIDLTREFLGDFDDFKKLWSSGKEIGIRTESGVFRPFTFSFDSEISYADGLLVIAEKQEWLDELNQMLSEVEIKENGVLYRAGSRISSFFSSSREVSAKIDLLNIPIESILKLDGRSNKQFFAFGGLRAGVEPNKTHYSITDLNPRLFDDYMNLIVREVMEDPSKFEGENLFSVNSTQANLFIGKYKKLIEKVLVENKKLPVAVTNDMAYIELPHSSYERIPSRLKEIVVEGLHKMFKWRSTHLHMGIPGEISDKKSFAIARAVEARIIIEHAMATAKPSSELYATSYSSLVTNPGDAKKSAGVIRFNRNRHSSPSSMHDLEVRNYLSLNEGMNHIALGVYLGKNHEKLATMPVFSAEKIADPYTANLCGALHYLGYMFSNHPKQSYKKIGEILDSLSNEIEEEGVINEEMRKKAYDLLHQYDVLDLIVPELFFSYSV